MKTAIISTGLFLILINGFSQIRHLNNSHFLGAEYPVTGGFPQFSGYKDNAGSMLEPIEAGYSVNQLENNTHDVILTFNKVIKLNNTSHRRLLDTLHVGKIGRSKLIIIASCVLNRKKDTEIIALVNYKSIPKYTQILHAWRANKKTGKFEKIATRNIACIDPGYSEVD